MRILGGILGLLFLAIFSLGCSNEKSSKPVSAPIPITVGMSIQKTVPMELRAIGNVQAYSTVTVKSKVGGELVRVHFAEGQDVRKGALLFTIDPRPYEAALKLTEARLESNLAQVQQAKANLERDLARAKNAEDDARRYEFLIERGVVARQQYEKMRADADALEATVRADRAAIENAEAAVSADRAAIENAKIQLGYCLIRSSIDGRTGSLLIQQGSIVKAEDVNLVVINQIIPIEVAFSVPEQFLPEIKKYMASGKLQFEALAPMNEERPDKGIVTFIDNAVDSSTGTIRLKGTFANRERKLWPGQFVNVVLTLTREPNTIVVPSQAIQTGQEGQYVFVVKQDLTVESRPVVVGRSVNSETVVQKGLRANEKVVTDGQLRLYPGARVEIKTSDSANATQKKTP
ncbi:MAG: efflux transporter periplasmic adaptor subunit [Deltaproteobacteria bacterium RBG_16_48_10]|nr:MAG: efflux transporter periplasmic adaptor subunit [Deltaproteobacteria bacterium RBG_16_48_10]